MDLRDMGWRGMDQIDLTRGRDSRRAGSPRFITGIRYWCSKNWHAGHEVPLHDLDVRFQQWVHTKSNSP
jgi:hypothetical protein